MYSLIVITHTGMIESVTSSESVIELRSYIPEDLVYMLSQVPEVIVVAEGYGRDYAIIEIQE